MTTIYEHLTNIRERYDFGNKNIVKNNNNAIVILLIIRSKMFLKKLKLNTLIFCKFIRKKSTRLHSVRSINTVKKAI